MKKNIFHFFVLLFVASTTISMITNDKAETSKQFSLSSDKCMNETFEVFDELISHDLYTMEQITCAGNVVYAACEGWPVTWNEFYACF